MNATVTAEPIQRLFVGTETFPACAVELPTGTAWVVSTASPEHPDENQDAAAILGYTESASVLVVADGVGGERAGARASRLAVESVAARLNDAAREGVALRTAILDGIERANHAVSELGGGAATTVVVVGVDGSRVRPYHVGDSAILVCGQRGKIKHQNIPHGPVGYAVEAGVLDEGEAMHHEDRNVVSNVVGTPDMRIEVGPSLTLAVRDTVVLASDGLSDNMFEQEIIDLVRRGPLPEAAEALHARAHRRMTRPSEDRPSKADDLTFILYRPRAAAPAH